MIAEHEYAVVAVADLHEWPGNPRNHPREQIDALKTSFQQFGNVQTLVVQKSTNRVLGGNGRLEALRELRVKKTPVMLVDIDDARGNILNVALNGLGLNSTWNEELLKPALMHLLEVDIDPIVTGLSTDELDRIVGDIPLDATTTVSAHERRLATEVVEDEAPELPADPVSKPGDVWRLGMHTLVVGDCTTEGFKKRAKEYKPDTLWADPPYGVTFLSNSRSKAKPFTVNDGLVANDDLRGDELSAFVKSAVAYLIEMTERAYVCLAWNRIVENIAALGAPKTQIIWDKNCPGLGFGYRHQYEVIFFYGMPPRDGQSDLWSFNRDQARTYKHPTQKPVALSAKALSDAAARKAIDPFAGSGSSLMAAEQLGVQMLTCELMPGYADIIVARWEQATGREAVRQRGAAKDCVNLEALAVAMADDAKARKEPAEPAEDSEDV